MTKLTLVIVELTRASTGSKLYLFKAYSEDVSNGKLVYDLECEVNSMGGSWDGSIRKVNRSTFKLLLEEKGGIVQSG